MMTKHRQDKRKSSCLFKSLMLLAGFVLIIGLLLGFYRPDRPVANIIPGSSAGPTFVVQVIRPRVGLPLGGLLPPKLFGVDAQLGFDSNSDTAQIHRVGVERIEFGTQDWKLLLVRSGDGRVTTETEVVFDIMFEGQVRRVRCRPTDPAVGNLNTVRLKETGELSGSFNIELGPCEDLETETSLGWPSQPLILRGSFDRLPLDGEKPD